MPCYSPGADADLANKATRAGCEACRLLEKKGLLRELSAETKKWFSIHKRTDAVALKELARQDTITSQKIIELRRKILSLLTREERQLLNNPNLDLKSDQSTQDGSI